MEIRIKYLYLVLFFIFSSTIFGELYSIKKVGYSNFSKKITLEFDKSYNSDYKQNYDPQNRLIFLEFKNANLNVKPEEKNFINKYIESFKALPLGSGAGFFIKIRKNIAYKIKNSGKKLDIEFYENASMKQFTIAIDAGHGGKDPGASYFGKDEKDIVLSVALQLKKELEDNFNVILTRSSDNFVNLSDRPRIANDRRADMFISLHANASENSKASGIEVFYFSKQSSPYAARIAKYENSFGEMYGENVGGISQILGELEYKKYQELSAKLAKKISSNLSESMNMSDRGIYGANFAVLRGLGRPKTAIPGVLVEIGYLTNKEDILKISNHKNHKIIASSIAQEVKNYFD